MTDRAPLTRRSLFALAGAVGVGALAAGCSAQRAGEVATGTASPVRSANVSITRVSPSTVPLAGAVTVSVTGTGLASVKGVTVGGIAATKVSASSTRVSFLAPHQAMYTPGRQKVELFSEALTPVPTANQTDGGANGSETLDGVSGSSASGSASASATATATPASAIATTNLTYAAKTDVDRQLQYAMAHWSSYNTAAYGNMNSIGGDCANFVSQTLIARGFTQTQDWYSKDAGVSHSTSWTYCPDLDTWLTDNASTYGLTKRTLAERDHVQVGDIIMFDWNDNSSPDHTTIVSEVFTKSDGSVLIKSASHNEDGPYRDLDDMITVLHPGGTAWFHSFAA